MLDTTELAAALKALDAQMNAAGLLPPVTASRRLDQLVAMLDTDGFLSLRTLPGFWALLALWELPNDSPQAPEPRADDVLNDAVDDAVDEVETSSDEQPPAPAAETLRLPHPHTAIPDARLGRRFDRLIIRLQRSAARTPEVLAPIERLQDILNLSEESFFRLEGVGKTYRDDWHALKALYAQVYGLLLPVEPEAVKMSEPRYDVHDDMLLNLKQLDSYERKAVVKLKRALGTVDIQTILNFSSLNQAAVNALGNVSVTRVLQVQQRVIGELQRIAEGTLDYRTNLDSLITRAPSFESVAALGNFLLGRLDSYLAGLDETRQLIFQYRWGFVDERLTLSEIGEKFDLSRERIRQLESKVNGELIGYLTLDADVIWQAAQSLLHDELRLQMEDLCACFTEQGYFHDFLEFVSHGRVASLTTVTLPPLGLLEDYFALHGTAIAQQTVLQELQKCLGCDEKNAHSALLYLQAQGQVALAGGQVRPLRLKKHEAAAAVLSEHPNGLPWLDITRYANSRGISRSPFSEQIAGHGLHDSPLMYVSGKGVYRHTRFIDFNTIDDAAIFAALHGYFANLEREVSHLSEAHGDSPVLRQHDYYIVRYLVKMRGEVHGIYFNGKSQTDSISLNPEFELYSQKSVILQALQRGRAPMTKTEVAQLLKSRSVHHATIYLHELTLANQLVQVDRMLYTIPELAYENVDMDAMRQSIGAVLQRHSKPVDPSVIQAELNLQQGATYSKYFYGSLARYFAQQEHWHRRQNLFASQPIAFSSLTGAIDSMCSMDASMEVNIEVLRQHITITDDAARASIYNWKAAKARSRAGASLEEEEEEEAENH